MKSDPLTVHGPVGARQGHVDDRGHNGDLGHVNEVEHLDEVGPVDGPWTCRLG